MKRKDYKKTLKKTDYWNIEKLMKYELITPFSYKNIGPNDVYTISVFLETVIKKFNLFACSPHYTKRRLGSGIET